MQLFAASDAWNLRSTFGLSATALMAVFLPLFFVFVRYPSSVDSSDQVGQYYQWFLDVEFMVFLGFGGLMTFLRRYSYSAIAFNFLISAFVIMYSILILGSLSQVAWGIDHRIILDFPLLINCTFAAASAMIAFGAFIGKASPTQVLWLSFVMIPLYALNQQLVYATFKALDVGGSVSIHAFGAYYGLAASLVLSRDQEQYTSVHPKNSGSYTSDVFSMIGTLFLWLYWPSFNAALASYNAVQAAALPAVLQSAQMRAIVNTVLALLGSCLSTFAASAFVDNRFNIMHVQNSSLAGGVAIGAAASLYMTPGGALLVGMAAGVISVVGFAFLTPLLERLIGLGDTCGVHNLHGIPGILGGLVAGFAALGQDAALLQHSSRGAAFGFQLAAVAVTVAIGAAGGTLGGFLVTAFDLVDQKLTAAQLFEDGTFWTDVDVEALPLDHADSSRHSTVHRGAARVWADASHSLHAGGRSEHGVFGHRAVGGSAQGSPARAKKAENGVDVEPGVRQPGWPTS